MGWSPELPAELTARVDDYREDKVRRLDSVLATLPGGDRHPWSCVASTDLPLRYALAHHVFEGVSRAVQRGDSGAIAAHLALRSNQHPLRVLSTAAGPVLTAHPARELMTSDKALAEAPVALVSEEICATADAADRDLTARALTTAVEAGFGQTVRRNTRVVVLIAERRPTDDTIRSWTTNALPATVHLDYFAEHFYVSRDLIHEAVHTQLNDLFAAFEVTFPEEAGYFAPWLATHRPAFGFLHGTWAFSHVALFCRWLATTDAPADVRALGAAMDAKYSEHMYESRQDFDRAIGLIGVPALADAIVQCRDQVLEGHSARV
ncbi:HEXXH motif-containing protein [Lentzea albidocapillata subsp. violacea]|uniref:HEXXH motif-containing protein n=1 Tax=Lentzea albidocapillata subsp. violacea TaxID=128104 RepID=A0A1G9XUW8_9PSEU|nr:HEXXH motif-containing putative peptide modification protein [Lentzea albidocapillata]SDN00632.1 HEXXH motif-containing protein [Lentzea albidocapillata subsp. violacea]